MRGRPVVLAFFAAEWDPVRSRRLELYNQVLSQIPGEARLVGISGSRYWCDAELSDGDLVAFAVVQGISTEGAVAERYGVKGSEAVFVIDAAGRVRWRHVGPSGIRAEVDQLTAVLRSMAPRNGVTGRDYLATAIATMVALTLVPRESPAIAGPSHYVG